MRPLFAIGEVRRYDEVAGRSPASSCIASVRPLRRLYGHRAERVRGVQCALATLVLMRAVILCPCRNNQQHPLGPFPYTISAIQCTTVSFSQGGEGLGAMSGEEKAREMPRGAGFTKVEVEQPLYDFANHYFIITKN